MTHIKFFYQTPLPLFKKRSDLKTFLTSLTLSYKRSIDSLNIIFCTDDYLLTINQDFLQHDYYTDIITFDLSTSPSSAIQGELYISIDRVKENAQTHGEHYIKELHRVIFHGLLHLLGFNDKESTDQLVMREKENELLSLYFS